MRDFQELAQWRRDIEGKLIEDEIDKLKEVIEELEKLTQANLDESSKLPSIYEKLKKVTKRMNKIRKAIETVDEEFRKRKSAADKDLNKEFRKRKSADGKNLKI